MNACELTTLITALANAIAVQIPGDGLALFASAVIQLGETLETIAVQRELCKTRAAKPDCPPLRGECGGKGG